METTPSPDGTKQTQESPAPETLSSQNEVPKAAADGSPAATPAKPPVIRRNAYRPSHKATFVGIAAVLAILAVNAIVIGYVLRSQQSKPTSVSQSPVTISGSALDKLGVNRNPVGNKGIELVVNPDAKFNGQLQVGGDMSVAGQLKLNSKFSASDASLTQLQAGKTAVSDLTVNGDATATNVNVRKDLQVAGALRLQGDVTLSRLLTVNNSANVAGNMAVGGTLTAGALQSRSLIITSAATFGGHIITSGNAPAVRPAGGVGSNGTVSISGNDMAGTVAVNIGVGGTAGALAAVSFHSGYQTTPHVVVSAASPGGSGVFATRSASGFTIGTDNPLPPGGYIFDYIVMQ